jgi:hypothetical protein
MSAHAASGKPRDYRVAITLRASQTPPVQLTVNPFRFRVQKPSNAL